jgi:hypothetical protein
MVRRAQRTCLLAHTNNDVIDLKAAIIIDVEVTRTIRRTEVGGARTITERDHDDAGVLTGKTIILAFGVSPVAAAPARRRRDRRQREATAALLRWHLDRVQGRPRHQVQTDPRTAQRLRVPDNRPERGR